MSLKKISADDIASSIISVVISILFAGILLVSLPAKYENKNTGA